jgi:hypothetical protein
LESLGNLVNDLRQIDLGHRIRTRRAFKPSR